MSGSDETDLWPDGWIWYRPVTDPSSELEDELELLADALRRAVDLRDALAEAGEHEASGATRAVKLIQVLNVAWRKALRRRFGPAISDAEIVYTRPWELIEHLRSDGRLTRGRGHSGDGN